MQKIQQLYRKNYLGEDVITNRVYQNSKWNPTTEFIPTESYTGSYMACSSSC
jgi:hypothetical protein